MIRIKKSETADTRTCDWSKVSKDTLRDSSISHIHDVEKGLAMFCNMLISSAAKHDVDKLKDIDGFHEDFKTGFEKTTWWDSHRTINRHHLTADDGVRDDVNLVDVLEFITDCVMAGMARSGSVYELKLKREVLQKAFDNTVELLKGQVEVVEV